MVLERRVLEEHDAKTKNETTYFANSKINCEDATHVNRTQINDAAMRGFSYRFLVSPVGTLKWFFRDRVQKSTGQKPKPCKNVRVSQSIIQYLIWAYGSQIAPQVNWRPFYRSLKSPLESL